MRAIVLLALVGLVSVGELAAARQSSLNVWRRFGRAKENAQGNRDEKNQIREEDLLRSILNSTAPVPDEIDWRQHPEVVSPVLDQGQCAASFAFAAAGVLEGQQVARGLSKKLQPLSAGQVLHCSIHNKRCYGGQVASALNDIARLGGIETASDFTYFPSGFYCNFKSEEVFMKFAGSRTLPVGEAALKYAVGSYGPVAVQIHANDLVYNYKSGIFDEATCDGGDLNQAMLVVGYGTDPKEGDFWILASNALDDMARLGGIETASDYKYYPAGHFSDFAADKVFMKFAGSRTLPVGEAALKYAVGSYGPVAVQIHVNVRVYKYKSGIFDEATCDGGDLNQAMLVVGYGTDPKEGDFWILKNSWSAKWGENGYIRMRRGKGTCGLGLVSVIARF